MHLHEYQAKEILRKKGVKVPDFEVISKLSDVRKAIEHLGISEGVVKVQVHAGGRGKAGGVRLAKNPHEIMTACKQLLGMRIVNEQTGPEGLVSHQILLTNTVQIEKEFYLAATIDRTQAQALLIVSPQGGMEIEKIAETAPHKIMTIPISKDGKWRGYQLIEIAKFMGWTGGVAEQGDGLIKAVTRTFVETDAMLIEINPLVLSTEGDLLALDAKMTIDDNALFRHHMLQAYRDVTQLTPQEAKAQEYDLAYVALEGDIGCMVNGAGLAMATMDIIHHYGGRPANFLDVGGSASQEKIAEGFKILLTDEKLKAILVNIFGGIMNCVTLAAGIVVATNELGLRVPLIVRMEGTNVENGIKILADSGLNIQVVNSLSEAAKKAVEAAQGTK